MAKIIKNEKKFKIIELTKSEHISIGGLSICDACNKDMFKGYYIAVLNRSYCDEDYKNWLKSAVLYSEDISYETRKFNEMRHIFKLK